MSLQNPHLQVPRLLHLQWWRRLMELIPGGGCTLGDIEGKNAADPPRIIETWENMGTTTGAKIWVESPKNGNLFFVPMIVGERGIKYILFIFLQVGGPVSKMKNNKLIWNLRNGQHVPEESNSKVRQFGPNTLNFTCFKMPLIYKMVFKNTKTDISSI